MNLLKTSFYTSISTAITFFSGFILVKVIAIKIGPEGISQLGQYQNTTALLVIASTLSISVGVTKYLAEFKDDIFKRQKIITTSIIAVIFSSLIISVLTVLFSRTLSLKSFYNLQYWQVYALFGSLLCFTSLNVLFSSFLNGLKEIKKLTIVNITTSLVGLAFTVTLGIFFGLIGVLISANFTAIIMFILNVYFLKKITEFQISANKKNFDFSILKLLLLYSSMSAITLVIIPINQLFIRDYIIQNQGFTKAGYWQAVTKISDYYLLFITSVFSVYYLPVLSELSDRVKIKQEVWKGYKIILPFVAALAIIIFFCKTIIIKILFSKAFLPMKPLFLFQLIGDFLKIGSWLLGYLLAAKAMIKTIILLEILGSLTLILFTRFFLEKYGLIGATYAFALNYSLYWITVILITRRYIFNIK